MEIVQGMEVYELVILMIAGALLVLSGYRIKKIAFFIIWFILGYNLAGFLMPWLEQMVPQIAENDLWQILIPIGGGLLLALLGFSIEKFCVGGICFALAMLVTVRYFGTTPQFLAIGGVVGVIAAGAAVMLMKPATIVATSLAGAYALTLAVFALSAEINQEIFYWPMLVGITLLGTMVQFLTTKRMS